jgi:hypothetical protein
MNLASQAFRYAVTKAHYNPTLLALLALFLTCVVFIFFFFF